MLLRPRRCTGEVWHKAGCKASFVHGLDHSPKYRGCQRLRVQAATACTMQTPQRLQSPMPQTMACWPTLCPAAGRAVRRFSIAHTAGALHRPGFVHSARKRLEVASHSWVQSCAQCTAACKPRRCATLIRAFTEAITILSSMPTPKRPAGMLGELASITHTALACAPCPCERSS